MRFYIGARIGIYFFFFLNAQSLFMSKKVKILQWMAFWVSGDFLQPFLLSLLLAC